MATLQTYRSKRNFDRTSEPRGRIDRRKGRRFVIQKHAARRLHYDLRIELDGVMKSWAVTRGPSLVPADKRLAIAVEDHPIEYNRFEGVIPRGEYGGGTVMIWDRGRWLPEGDPHRSLRKGHLEFQLDGRKLHGRWHLVRMTGRADDRKQPWLLIKARDRFARRKSDPDILKQLPDSAYSGRTMDEIAADKRKVWHSDKRAKAKTPDARGTRQAAQKARKPRLRRAAARAKNAVRRGARARPATARNEAARIDGARKAHMPTFVAPCLATLSNAAPSSSDWLHEVKFDGYRIQARIAHGTVTLKTRTGLDWTSRFPTVAKALGEVGPHDAILDGEIVSVDRNGVSDFAALQDDLKSGRQDRLCYYVFDVLYLDGFDLTGAALTERQAALQMLLSGGVSGGVIRLSKHFETDGTALLKHACRLKLEGIVSKRRNAPYRSGRVGDWLKTKCASSQEFVVIGYEPSDKRSRLIRALLLGYFEDGVLRYAGRVGTGWGEAREHALMETLARAARATAPLDPIPPQERRRPVQWLEPRIVVEVDFRGWTGGNLVRQASLQGLREDKPARQVVREAATVHKGRPRRAALRQKTPKKTQAKARRQQAHRPVRVTVAGVTLTHPDRLYWPDAGVSKEMLARHYAEVWDWMRPHVTRRVLALVRCPDGIAKACFFQKHASAGIDAARLTLVKEPDGERSIAITDLAGLVSLAQAGALEIHLRGSTLERLEEANRLVFDLDPGPGVGWPALVAAAREVRERLRERGLESFVKSTGGKGLHVVLPVRPAPWEAVKPFCRGLAEQMAEDSPDRYTATSKKTARRGRIFVDYLRNSREATAIAPYSTRARPGAAVATPLSWDELASQGSPNAFTLLNVGKRLARLRGDPWAEMSRLRQRLPGVGQN